MTMVSTVSPPEGQPDLSQRSRQCTRYLLGALIRLLGLILVFAGVLLIGLPLAAAGMGMCRKAIRQARAVAPVGGPVTNSVDQSQWRGVRQFATIGIVCTLMVLLWLLLQRPIYAARHVWVWDGYLAVGAIVLAIFAVKAILTTRKVFFVEYGRVGPSVAPSAGQLFQQELRTDRFMHHTRWLGYGALVIGATSLVLLFALPKDSPFALWLVYGVAATGGVYVLAGSAGVVRIFILALLAKAHRDPANR